MKRKFTRFLLLSAMIFGISWSAGAQVFVRVRPAVPHVRMHPVAPSPRHIWIEGNWVVRGRQYVWHDGYWVVPKRGHRWSKGHWQHTRRGYVWVPGRWERGRGRY
ncbi:MAG: hypothetical protein EOO04_18275 [Chitinophagaceae bacterium]|nr:MAG: hypothetical protein EOO04_18275 [Chitinophagaceae bacterium]